MEGYEILNVFIDASIMLETIIDARILNKECFSESFKKALGDQIDQVGAIYATMEHESPIKYEIGVVLYDLERQHARVVKYELDKKRKSQDYEAMVDAYSYPEIAALVEYTKGHLKTRNKCYKR